MKFRSLCLQLTYPLARPTSCTHQAAFFPAGSELQTGTRAGLHAASRHGYLPTRTPDVLHTGEPKQALYFMELNLARMASMTEPRSFLTGVGALANWHPMPSISREWYATCAQRRTTGRTLGHHESTAACPTLLGQLPKPLPPHGPPQPPQRQHRPFGRAGMHHPLISHHPPHTREWAVFTAGMRHPIVSHHPPHTRKWAVYRMTHGRFAEGPVLASRCHSLLPNKMDVFGGRREEGRRRRAPWSWQT